MSLTDPRPPLSRSPDADSGGDLRFIRTAPRHLVDRSAVAEVLITDWRRVSSDAFRLAAQWPRGHHFYAPVAGAWYDPLLAAESLRQAAVLVGQAYYDVPADRHFRVAELEFEIVPSALLLGLRPAELHLESAITEVRRRTGAPTALTMETDLLRDGEFAGAGRLTLHMAGPRDHEQAASADPHPVLGTDPGHPPLSEPVPPAIVGRLDERDVVLGLPGSAAGRRDLAWSLRVDPGHPVLFDHATGDVPGMVLLEAARQAAQAACAPYRVLTVEIRSAFHLPLAQSAPCHISAARLPTQDAGEEAVLRVAAWQFGRLAFDSLVVAALCD
ncbi:ScbA/BarX family gamma-butyrolactone biosynthesis protein [Streptomyces sp. SM14]|uniref:ScbA/BarX family gamma-butyrolactone biosynthesis protein n=1 Tax=Streptomyces sp. SM14 TaxID=1736045 RepID=UPI000CD566D8|nr:ScbA/BarX family gamma-butyrolactone biosynthesis protein [Streptomyces sp. SM14]